MLAYLHIATINIHTWFNFFPQFSTWFSEFPGVCNVQQFTNSPGFPNSQVLAMETALPYLHMLRQLREAYTEAWNSLCGGRLVVLIIMIMLMLIMMIIILHNNHDTFA